MISWIVASHQPDVLGANLKATLQLAHGEELVVVTDAPSIAKAYNEGQARSRGPIRVYVHHDIQIRDNAALRAGLIERCQPWVGIVGIIGSWNRAVPYWTGASCGSVEDARIGVIGPGKGGECVYLDGLLLATAREVEWDESYPGWHWYDHDICEQALDKGLPNWCLPLGHQLVLHNTTSGHVPDELPDWQAGREHFREKWGH